EVRVPLRDAGPPGTRALQPDALDQTPGVIAVRVLEDRARVRLAVGLGGRAPRARLVHSVAYLTALVPAQAEAHRGYDEAGRQRRAPVAEDECAARQLERSAVATEAFHGLDRVRQLAAVGARVHEERPAHRARDALGVLEAGQAARHGRARETPELHGGPGMDGDEVQIIWGPVRCSRGSRRAAIKHPRGIRRAHQFNSRAAPAARGLSALALGLPRVVP